MISPGGRSGMLKIADQQFEIAQTLENFSFLQKRIVKLLGIHPYAPERIQIKELEIKHAVPPARRPRS